MEPFGKQILAILTACGVMGGIFVILRDRPVQVRLAACGFVTSLVSTQLLMKGLCSPPFAFRFPATVTTLHFLCVWFTSMCFWWWNANLRMCLPGSIGPAKRYAQFVLPIALSLPMSVAFNNKALLFMGAGLNGVFGTIAPVSTAVLQHLCGRRIPRRGWLGIVVAFLGATLIGVGELQGLTPRGESAPEASALLGFVFAGSAVVLRSAKVILQDQLVEPSAYARTCMPVSPMHAWAVQGLPCIAVSGLYAISSETLSDAYQSLSWTVAVPLLASCVSAVFLNFLGMFTIQQLGASSMTIVGKLNTIILVAFSAAFLGESLYPAVMVGAMVVLSGIALFERETGRAREKASRLPH